MRKGLAKLVDIFLQGEKGRVPFVFGFSTNLVQVTLKDLLIRWTKVIR